MLVHTKSEMPCTSKPPTSMLGAHNTHSLIEVCH